MHMRTLNYEFSPIHTLLCCLQMDLFSDDKKDTTQPSNRDLELWIQLYHTIK